MRTSRIVIVAVAALTLCAAVAYGHLSTPRTADAAAFEVRQGESVRAVAERLADAGIIRNAAFFRLRVRDTDLASTMQPGVYDLRSARTLEEIAGILGSGGANAREFTLLIKEGENIAGVIAALDAAGYERSAEVFAVVGRPPAVNGGSPMAPSFKDAHPSLRAAPDGSTAEGYLFPDTYRMFFDATPEEVAGKLVEHFELKVTPEIAAGWERQGLTPHEAITLASIIEREVRGEEDMRMVADLFLRRLEIGLALQADSTVNYATGKSLPSVTAEDLEVDSRYNTYLHRGLPPGPISNPGLAALRAVAEPIPNGYLYFLTDPAGKVYYARTFEEHGRNRVNYLR